MSAVYYDEVNLSDREDLDIRFDTFIPTPKEENMFFFRSLINESLKMPVYILHNSAHDLITYMDIISLLENLELIVLVQIYHEETRHKK